MGNDYYNKDYFDWQKNIGAFGGSANLFKFEEFIKPEYTVLDFGCGGGYLLKNIQANKKIGVEINPDARKKAIENGIEVYEKLEEIEDNSIDLVISNHALEHVENPCETLRKILLKLKPQGKVVFVVPHQNPDEEWYNEDVNMHIYTWNRLTFGNLFKVAGYKIISVENIRHKWPDNFVSLRKKFGLKIFNLICKINAYKNNNYQIRIVAQREI